MKEYKNQIQLVKTYRGVWELDTFKGCEHRNKIIKVTKYKYLKSFVYASRHNQNTYFGFCNNCLDKCGIISSQKKINEYF